MPGPLAYPDPPLTDGVVELLRPSARGNGLATRAVRLATTWALTPGRGQRVEAWVEPGNSKSQARLTRCGFQREGTLRSFLAFDGRRSDAIVFSQLPTDLARPASE